MPGYYRKSRIIASINDINSKELDSFDKRLEEVLNQFFVDTADFSLGRWEEELGLEVNNKQDSQFRKSKINSKLRGQGTITVKLIKNVAEAFSNGEVEVVENNPAYKFTVKFVGTRGIPPNLDDLKRSIEEIKPAHLDYEFEYSYLTWDEFDNYNKTFEEWDRLNLSWDKFEVYI